MTGAAGQWLTFVRGKLTISRSAPVRGMAILDVSALAKAHGQSAAQTSLFDLA
jgi:hypothetical protein